MKNNMLHEAQDTQNKLIDKLGWQLLPDGIRVYCAGNVVIGSEGIVDYPVSEELSSEFVFEYDPDMTIEKSIEEALKIIHLNSESSSILFTTGLLGLMRSMFIEANLKVEAPVYLCGESQVARKTTTSKLCTRMYKRSILLADNSVCFSRVNSSKSAIEENLDKCKDTTFICDDLYRSVKKKEVENNHTVSEVIREFADNSSRQVSGRKFGINAHVIITAEYILPNRSDMGRCFLVMVENGTEDEKINQCLDVPLALSTAYYYFIQYLCKNYDEIIQMMSNNHKAYYAGLPMMNTGFSRLHEMKYVLGLAMSVFLQWCSINGGNKIDIDSCANLLECNMSKCILQEEKVLKFLAANEKYYINFAKVVVDLLMSGRLQTEHAKEKEWIIIKRNRILVTLNYLSDVISKETGITVTGRTLSKYFDDLNISKREGDKRVVKYGKGGKRYLCLGIDKLEAEATSALAAIKDKFSYTQFKM